MSPTGIKRAGAAVFVAGVILASLFAVPEPPRWGPFILGLLITVAGGLMARCRPRASKRKRSEKAADEFTPKDLMSGLRELGRTLSGAGKRPGQGRIEELLTALSHMIEQRYVIQEQVGMQAFAEIFSQLSMLERTLNRAWAAFVDGYPGEIEACMAAARTQLTEAERLVGRHC